jgi:hypothetical protein
MLGTSPASSYGSFRYVQCYALKAIKVEFWNYRNTDCDLTVTERDCRKKRAVT